MAMVIMVKRGRLNVGSHGYYGKEGQAERGWPWLGHTCLSSIFATYWVPIIYLYG